MFQQAAQGGVRLLYEVFVANQMPAVRVFEVVAVDSPPALDQAGVDAAAAASGRPEQVCVAGLDGRQIAVSRVAGQPDELVEVPVEVEGLLQVKQVHGLHADMFAAASAPAEGLRQCEDGAEVAVGVQ